MLPIIGQIFVTASVMGSSHLILPFKILIGAIGQGTIAHKLTSKVVTASKAGAD